jgi:hypothetical protein
MYSGRLGKYLRRQWPVAIRRTCDREASGNQNNEHYRESQGRGAGGNAVSHQQRMMADGRATRKLPRAIQNG